VAAVITRFPFAEKIIAPYILLLVTTPMLALVPLLILNFGFGFAPRIIAVALASGPMVMINSAIGFRRVDLGKIALARPYGATTLQIFTKIRIPMAMPMVIVRLMMGAIFGLITAVGAEMAGGGFGLGSRLTTYSLVIRMPEFFACALILSMVGILIHLAVPSTTFTRAHESVPSAADSIRRRNGGSGSQLPPRAANRHAASTTFASDPDPARTVDSMTSGRATWCVLSWATSRHPSASNDSTEKLT